MNKEPHFRSLMKLGNFKESDLPDWLRTAITCYNEAATALLNESKSRQRELQPILEGSDAVISVHIDRILHQSETPSKIDKLKMMKIKAMAVEMLLKQG